MRIRVSLFVLPQVCDLSALLGASGGWWAVECIVYDTHF